MKKLIIFSSILVIALFATHNGWAQEGKNIHPPVITHAYATDKGRPGTIWKIYLEAEDAGGDMNYVFVVVDQPGTGRYPTDGVRLDPQHRSHLKAFLQWNTASGGAALAEGTPITVRISIGDKAGNVSNEIVFPFTFVSGISDQEDVRPPFHDNLPRIGYVGVNLVRPDRY